MFLRSRARARYPNVAIEVGGGEIGDKCAVNVIGAAGWGAQVYDNHLADVYMYNKSTQADDFYNVQKEWSNNAFIATGSGCVISG